MKQCCSTTSKGRRCLNNTTLNSPYCHCHQTGGHSTPTLKFVGDDTTENLVEIQGVLLQNLLLQRVGSQHQPNPLLYKQKLLEDLSRLLCVSNDKINVDFLNNFHRYVYVDQAGDYEIHDGQFNKQLNYMITKQVGSGAVGTTYMLSDEKGHHMVMKVINMYNQQTIGNINDYLSLEVFKFGKSSHWTYQRNYMEMSFYDYETYYNKNGVMNSLDRLIQTPTYLPDKTIDNDFHLQLATKNESFYNDIIVNLIMQRICLDHGDSPKNFVPYDGYFITKVNGVYKGCILMPYLHGSVERLIADLDQRWLPQGKSKQSVEHHELTNGEIYFTELITNFFEQINQILVFLKHPDYLFTHTDMKLENILYQKIPHEDGNHDPHIISVNSQKYFCDYDPQFKRSFYYKFYLSDFDKSSITYHKVRFYVNYETEHYYASWFPGFSSTQNLFKGLLDYGQNPTYVISRFMVDPTMSLESEVYAMRYVAFPFFIGFDFQSLMLSLFAWSKSASQLHLYEYSQPLNQMFRTFFAERDLIALYRIYTQEPWGNGKYGGNFGHLLTPLINQKTLVFFNKPTYQTLCKNLLNGYDFVNQRQPQGCDPINMLLLSSQRKIILGFPFYPDVIVTKRQYWGSKVTYIYMVLLNETAFFYRDQPHIHGLFISTGNSTEDKLRRERYLIYYNGNKFLKSNQMIVMTNRYSVTGIAYEYDDVDRNYAEVITTVYQPMLTQIHHQKTVGQSGGCSRSHSRSNYKGGRNHTNGYKVNKK
jgi:hypothetical protein